MLAAKRTRLLSVLVTAALALGGTTSGQSPSRGLPITPALIQAASVCRSGVLM